MSPRTIIHPTDFSSHSEAALKFASQVAAHPDDKLLIVHVAPPVVLAMDVMVAGYPLPGATTYPPANPSATTVRPAIYEQLFAVKPVNEGLEIDHELLEGDPSSEIVDLAKRVKASQIIMGSHGRQGITRVLVGSVAESVLRRAPCPVTVVKAQEDEPSQQES